MSRTLKIINGIILALFILCGGALIVPQLVGIDTVVVQQEMTGNVPVGTAVYAKKTESSTLAQGDRMLDLGTSSVGIYTVENFDADRAIVTVSGASQNEYNVSAYYLKVVASVPLIGYLMLATQSKVGIGILAALLIYVILAFIFAEIFKRTEDEDEDDEDESEDDDDFYRNLAEKRKQKKAPKPAPATYEDAGKEAKKNDQTAPKPADEKPIDFEAQLNDGGMTELSETAADAVEEDMPSPNEEPDSLPDVQAALEAALENQPLNRTETAPQTYALEPDTEEVNVDENGEIELAMPVRTADELLQKAYADGLDPKVREDIITGVTLVDFSDSL